MRILPGAALEDLRPIGERRRRRIERDTATSALMLREGVTVSLGLASVESAPGLSPDDLVRAADAALYCAKMGGRNRLACAAVEEAFVNDNPQSTLKLAHARGVVLLGCARGGPTVADTATRLAQKAILGTLRKSAGLGKRGIGVAHI